MAADEPGWGASTALAGRFRKAGPRDTVHELEHRPWRRVPSAAATFAVAVFGACAPPPRPPTPKGCSTRDRLELEVRVDGAYALHYPFPYVIMLPYIPPEYLRDQQRRVEILAALPEAPPISTQPHALCTAHSSGGLPDVACFDDNGDPRVVRLDGGISDFAQAYHVRRECITVRATIGDRDMAPLQEEWRRALQPCGRSTRRINAILDVTPTVEYERGRVWGADPIPKNYIRPVLRARLALRIADLAFERELGVAHPDVRCDVEEWQQRSAIRCGSPTLRYYPPDPVPRRPPRQMVAYQSARAILFRIQDAPQGSAFFAMQSLELPCDAVADFAVQNHPPVIPPPPEKIEPSIDPP
jgi:hypothetical protein